MLLVLGCFFPLALLFDGLGLLAMGLGGRKVIGLVAQEREQERAGERAGRAEGGSEASADDSGRV